MAGTKWTAAEEAKLSKLIAEGRGNKYISEVLGRSYYSVDNKIKGLMLDDRPLEAPPQAARTAITPLIPEDPHKELKDKILKETKNKGQLHLLDLLRALDTTYGELTQAIYELEQEGYEISLQEEHGIVNREMVASPGKVLTNHFERISKAGTIKVGMISDNQLGNKSSRLDVLNTAYEHFEAEGITTVYHAGNIIDGYLPHINAFEIVTDSGPSIEAQVRYAAKVYPQKKGITTYYVTGECHEGWYARSTGLNVGKAMQRIFEENGRKDFVYTGNIEGDVELRTPNISKHAQGPILRMTHPGGGTAYAKSYKTQKWAASLQGGEKPQVALIGHYHKQGYFLERNIHCVLAACTSDQSIFMRKLLIPAEVGYHIAEIKIGDDGAIVTFRVEFAHFFDRGYFQNFERV